MGNFGLTSALIGRRAKSAPCNPGAIDFYPVRTVGGIHFSVLMVWRRHSREEPAADDRASGRAGGAGRRAWPSSRGRVGGFTVFMAFSFTGAVPNKRKKEMRRRRWGRGNIPFLLCLPRWRSAAAFGQVYHKQEKRYERKPRAIFIVNLARFTVSDNDAIYDAREDMEHIHIPAHSSSETESESHIP